jgi:hypothetical protein
MILWKRMVLRLPRSAGRDYCRCGSLNEAAKSYVRAIALVTNERERSYLERRLREVESLQSQSNSYRQRTDYLDFSGGSHLKELRQKEGLGAKGKPSDERDHAEC